MANSDVKTTLFPFILDVNFSGSLVIQEDLSENQFEIVFVHVVACARYLIITHIREVKGSAKTKKRTEMRFLAV